MDPVTEIEERYHYLTKRGTYSLADIWGLLAKIPVLIGIIRAERREKQLRLF